MRRWPVAMLLGGVAGCTLLTDLNGLTGSDGMSDGGSGNDSAVTKDASSAGDGDASAASDTATPPVPRLVQNVSGSVVTTKPTLTTTFAPTVEGNLIVAAVTFDIAAASVVSISDNAPGGSNTYVTAGQRSVDISCEDAAEIWYAKNVRAGATSLTVVANTPVGMDVWALEFSGLDRASPLDVGAVTNNQGRSTVITAPAVSATNRSVVISTACSCGTVNGVRAGNPFTGLKVHSGNNTAYVIATAAGQLGAAWASTNDTWNASTVLFR